MIKTFLLLTLINISIFANVHSVVSIPPLKTFVEAIGGDKVDISVMVQLGTSPHTYEPKPSQMKLISTADVYFSIGIEFEDVWLDKFASINKNMLISKLQENIEKSGDPHIWTSPSKVKLIVKHIYVTLCEIDSQNKDYYTKNLSKFLKEIEQTDTTIRALVQNGSKFMVFHPAWGNFANDYNLTQIAIEVQGKSPKPKEMIQIIQTAKKDNIKFILTSAEFSDKAASQIAKELHIPVIKASPLSQKWHKNLINIAKKIAK